MYQRISLILGTHNDYLRLADENEFDDSELVTHTISEDAADIYQELGLLRASSEEERQQAQHELLLAKDRAVRERFGC